MEKRYIVQSEHGLSDPLNEHEAIRQVMIYADHGINSHIISEEEALDGKGLQ